MRITVREVDDDALQRWQEEWKLAPLQQQREAVVEAVAAAHKQELGLSGT